MLNNTTEKLKEKSKKDDNSSYFQNSTPKKNS